MAVFTDAAEEKLDAAIGLDLCLVGVAFRDEIEGSSVEDVHVLRGDIDCLRGQEREKDNGDKTDYGQRTRGT